MSYLFTWERNDHPWNMGTVFCFCCWIKTWREALAFITNYHIVAYFLCTDSCLVSFWLQKGHNWVFFQLKLAWEGCFLLPVGWRCIKTDGVNCYVSYGLSSHSDLIGTFLFFKWAEFIWPFTSSNWTINKLCMLLATYSHPVKTVKGS